MTRAAIAVSLLLAALLAGCSDNLANSRMFYVGPNFNRDEDKSCDELRGLITGMNAQIKAIEGRIAKAEQDPGGGFVAVLAHRPALAPAQAQRFAYREAAQKQGCQL
jgi:hypothetical protein